MKLFTVLTFLVLSVQSFAEKNEQSKAVQVLSVDSIKPCLAALSNLQNTYLKEHQQYSEEIQKLNWGSNSCYKAYNWKYLEFNKNYYKIEASSNDYAWTIDSKKMMIKIK